MIAVVLGVRGFRKSARIAAMLELTPEGGALYESLVQKLGKGGIDDVARWTRASAEAQILVREEGAAGIEALHAAKGNVAAARQTLQAARKDSIVTANRQPTPEILKAVGEPSLVDTNRT